MSASREIDGKMTIAEKRDFWVKALALAPSNISPRYLLEKMDDEPLAVMWLLMLASREVGRRESELILAAEKMKVAALEDVIKETARFRGQS